MEKFCELCVDCEDGWCCGRYCHKNTKRCIITDDCFKQCDGIGGFIGEIPIFDWEKIMES